MSIIPNCGACKHEQVDPENEPCKTCLSVGKVKGIVASEFEEKENENER